MKKLLKILILVVLQWLRAAAKNYNDVTVITSINQYDELNKSIK